MEVNLPNFVCAAELEPLIPSEGTPAYDVELALDGLGLEDRDGLVEAYDNLRNETLMPCRYYRIIL